MKPLTVDLPQVALLAAALAAADRGWHVHPLRPGAKTPALHGEERCPRTGECTGGHRRWEQRATTDPKRIERAWAHAPYNIGIATGPSGLVVVDLDMPKGGTTTVVDLHGRRDDAAFLAGVVYVGRPLDKGGWDLPGHPLANPFPLTRGTTRADVVERYRAWLADQPDLVARHLPALRGKLLGCWCPAGQPCHARVLAELLNEDAPDGATTFKALCERAGQPWPTTYTVRTASGGQHLYFAAPPGVRLHNTAGKLGSHIDTRAWGGYVVAAGSTTPAGHYQVVDDAPVADLPAWLLTALTPPPRTRGPVALPSPDRASAYAQAALRNETDNVRHAPEGTRNQTLVRAARALGRLVASGDLPRTVVEEALNGAGVAAGLTERECRPAVTSALNWSISHNGGTAA